MIRSNQNPIDAQSRSQQPSTRTLAATPTGIIQRKCACGNHDSSGGQCKACRSTRLQRKASGVAEPETIPPIVYDVLGSPGRPLDDDSRAFMEPRFGYDFSRVRVHTDARAAESARSVNALAYTVGDHVVFGSGQYSPLSSNGRQLVAHELAHVVQQSRNGSENITSAQSDQLEKSADSAARAIDGHAEAVDVGGSSEPRLARAPGPGGGEAPKPRSDGLRPSEITMLNEVRSRLVPVAERSTAIVGVLVAEDGRKFEFKSGGGQGFSSHIEGKATAKMEELGIKKAVLLVEKEPCQICDRSVYPQETGPETPLRSSRTGAELSRQTPKINTAMKVGTQLMVVDPHSASLYWGTKSVPVPKLPATGGAAPRTPPGAADPSATPKTAAPEPAGTVLKGGVAPAPRTAPAAASRGAGAVASTEARLAAKAAAKDLSTNMKILKVARGLNGALHIVGFIGALLTLDTFTKMTMNSLAGKGFLLTKEIAEAESLAKEAASTKRDYVAFSERLTEMQLSFWRATQDSLAAGQAASSISDLDTSLDLLRGDLAEQIARVKAAQMEAKAKQKIAEKILSDPASSAAIAAVTMGTAELAMLFAASQDMSRIAGQLGTALTDLTALKAQVDEDFEFIHTWFGTLFDICRKGGNCSLTVIEIPFVGTSRIHGLPGEAGP